MKKWLSEKSRFLLCLGKAAVASAEAILSSVSCNDSFVLTPYPSSSAIPNIFYGSHPVPDQTSYHSTLALLNWIESLPDSAALLTILSGGTSALLVSPQNGISLESKMILNRLLIHCGASIHQINAVRKHISGVKGGQLGLKIQNLNSCVLVISDVIGDDFSVIGSGPFYPDSTTYQDCVETLKGFKIWDQTPQDIQKFLEEGIQKMHPETPKPGSLDIPHHIIASNRIARSAAAECAKQLGYSVWLDPGSLSGDVADAAIRIQEQMKRSGPGTACIFGGEITLRVQGSGSGGRNQHLAMLLTQQLSGSDMIFGAVGTDGIDGNSEAAGAWTDGTTMKRGSGFETFQRSLLDFDSYHYFRNVRQNILTGPTGTNVMDLYVVLV